MSRKSLKGRIALATAALAAIGAGGAAVALATGSPSGKAYAGCLNRGGTLYNIHVNPVHRLHCGHGGKVIHWNQMGPAGPPGAPGPQGPQGPTGASPTIAGTVVSDTGIVLATGHAGTSTLPCPAGDIASGGGGGFPTAGAANLIIQDSEPTMTGGIPTGWQLVVVNTSGSTATFDQFTVCLAASAAPGHLARLNRPMHEAATVRLTPLAR